MKKKLDMWKEINSYIIFFLSQKRMNFLNSYKAISIGNLKYVKRFDVNVCC